MALPPEAAISPPAAVILFDGVCNLCNRSVNFVIDHDAGAYYRFAALQSEAARPLLERCGLSSDFLAGVVLWEHGRCYTRSSAALRILRRLDGPWPLLYAAILVPRPLRNAVYDWIIRRRYEWFGRMESCRLPTPELKGRFLS